ncbi:hypothetical protein [Algiphilus sp.]|uniref:hypothetical protein n=1 Tax=Algiphilus sp. TaxID=1872431 RepID=UPI003BAD96E0
MSNPYRQFLRLLPRRPLLVGEITVVNSDGTVDVELPDSKTIRARGTGAVGDRVFVQDGEVRGSAPALPTSSVSV